MQLIRLTDEDALILVDLQNDFLPEGRLPVPSGDEVIPVANAYINYFHKKSRPVFATRDWHPRGHCSFNAAGGIWPQHCVADTEGSGFAAGLKLSSEDCVISKGTAQDRDAYSGFEGTDLHNRLENFGVKRLFIGGLALDVCVLNTVIDALDLGYEVFLLTDASRAVNVQEGDGDKAIESMRSRGVQMLEMAQLQ